MAFPSSFAESKSAARKLSSSKSPEAGEVITHNNHQHHQHNHESPTVLFSPQSLVRPAGALHFSPAVPPAFSQVMVNSAGGGNQAALQATAFDLSVPNTGTSGQQQLLSSIMASIAAAASATSQQLKVGFSSPEVPIGVAAKTTAPIAISQTAIQQPSPELLLRSPHLLAISASIASSTADPFAMRRLIDHHDANRIESASIQRNLQSSSEDEEVVDKQSNSIKDDDEDDEVIVDEDEDDQPKAAKLLRLSCTTSVPTKNQPTTILSPSESKLWRPY